MYVCKLASFFLLSACGFCLAPLCMQHICMQIAGQKGSRATDRSLPPPTAVFPLYVTVARHSYHHQHVAAAPSVHSTVRSIHTFCYASLNWQTNWLKLLTCVCFFPSFVSLLFLFYTFQLEINNIIFWFPYTRPCSLPSVPSLTLQTMRKQYKRFSRTFYLYKCWTAYILLCFSYSFYLLPAYTISIPPSCCCECPCGAFSQLFSCFFFPTSLRNQFEFSRTTLLVLVLVLLLIY